MSHNCKFVASWIKACAISLLLLSSIEKLSAQTSDTTVIEPPHAVQSLDENSVDLITGQYSAKLPGLSIGQGVSALTFAFEANSDQIVPTQYSGIKLIRTLKIWDQINGEEGGKSLVLGPGISDSFFQCFAKTIWSFSNPISHTPAMTYSNCDNGNPRTTTPDYNLELNETSSGGDISYNTDGTIKYTSRDGLKIDFESSPGAISSAWDWFYRRTKKITHPNGLSIDYYYKEQGICTSHTNRL